MAFRRSPVRSRSGPPAFARRRRASARQTSEPPQTHAKAVAPKRRRRGGGPSPHTFPRLSAIRLGRPASPLHAKAVAPQRPRRGGGYPDALPLLPQYARTATHRLNECCRNCDAANPTAGQWVDSHLLTQAPGLLRCRHGHSQALCLRSAQRQPQHGLLRGAGIRRQRATEGSQRGALSSHGSAQAVESACRHRIPGPAKSRALRALLEVWIGSRLCETSLRRLSCGAPSDSFR